MGKKLDLERFKALETRLQRDGVIGEYEAWWDKPRYDYTRPRVSELAAQIKHLEAKVNLLLDYLGLCYFAEHIVAPTLRPCKEDNDG